MANEFIKIGKHIINLAHVAHVVADNTSMVVINLSGTIFLSDKEGEAARWYFAARFEDDDAPFDVLLEHQLEKDGIRNEK